MVEDGRVDVRSMSLEGIGRIMFIEDRRTLIYVPKTVSTDSAWPFRVKDRVAVKIEPEHRRIIIEKLSPEPAQPKRHSTPPGRPT